MINPLIPKCYKAMIGAEQRCDHNTMSRILKIALSAKRNWDDPSLNSDHDDAYINSLLEQYKEEPSTLQYRTFYVTFSISSIFKDNYIELKSQTEEDARMFMVEHIPGAAGFYDYMAWHYLDESEEIHTLSYKYNLTCIGTEYLC